MKKPKDPRVYLKHILDNIQKIEKDLNKLCKKDFLNSDTIQDASIRRLEIIGEATKNLPKSFKEKHPEIDWKSIAGLRDILIHEYFGIDLDLVWKIIKKDIEPLKKHIESLITTP